MAEVKIIRNATLVSDGRSLSADLVVEGENIAAVENAGATARGAEEVDASGCLVLPGVIDTHVHFREPGMTEAATIWSESRAAAAGGVTSYFDMPNNTPPTTSLEAMEWKRAVARRDSLVNYSFFFGANQKNVGVIAALDPLSVCGVKVFMGSSTGNMLVSGDDLLRDIFASSPVPVVTHCEDMSIINANAAHVKEREGENAGVEWHSVVRSAEACYASSSKAVAIARETGATLHVAHISTARELSLFIPEDLTITAEACIPHLVFTDADYAGLGARIKCNPAIKTSADREALRRALTDGRIFSVATDHAPHPISRKQGGAFTAASGMPSVQFSLINMLELCEQGVLSIERAVQLMSHNPARLFGLSRRGFLHPGCFADFVIVRHVPRYTLSDSDAVSKCGWTPYAGREYSWRVERTYVGGQCVYSREGGFAERSCARELTFER